MKKLDEKLSSAKRNPRAVVIREDEVEHKTFKTFGKTFTKLTFIKTCHRHPPFTPGQGSENLTDPKAARPLTVM
ncbi:MAG TPA: hypothetical protein GX507_04855 [Clostridia bacterium]|nr:hypothetical protein [Clostridia bacterium]